MAAPGPCLSRTPPATSSASDITPLTAQYGMITADRRRPQLTQSNLSRRADKPIRQRPDGLVTFARAFAKTIQVQHADVAAPVLDETGLLERVGHDRHARPSHPQHLRQKLLGEGDVLAADQVAAAQQPAR